MGKHYDNEPILSVFPTQTTLPGGLEDDAMPIPKKMAEVLVGGLYVLCLIEIQGSCTKES